MKRLASAICAIVVSVGLLFGLGSCGEPETPVVPPVTEPEIPIVGFVAVGPETAWRTANEKDIQSAFKDAGIDLVYLPDSDHKKQVASFTKLVRDKVDAIVLTPAQADGWDEELQKAKDAKIPVFLSDRGIEPDDPDLYTGMIGPSNEWAGQEAAKFVNSTFPDGAKGFVLQGPQEGSSAQLRTKGWDETLADSIAVIDSQVGDWTTATAITQTTEMLEKFKDETISFIFAQNDEMGLGATEAVKDAGLQGGIKIVTIDATKPALKALVAGELGCVIEYNPLYGSTLVELVENALAGKKVAKKTDVSSTVFTVENAREALAKRKY